MTRFIDVHVHPPVASMIEGAFAPYLPGLEAAFGRNFPVMTVDQIADYYRASDGRAVLLAWDAESATGLPPLTNEEVASMVTAHPDVFVGFGSVDPHKGSAAVLAVAAAAKLGLRGLKFHPSVQRFAPSDESHYAIYEEASAYGMVALFHSGVTALGRGMPGGAGVRHRLAHPVHFDDLAAAFPSLTIVMAHAGAPWTSDAVAYAVHKPNLYVDLSGWSPKYFSDELMRAIRGPLRERVLFGSDFPFITPDQWLRAWDERGGGDEALTTAILHDNAARLLGEA